MNEQQKSLKLAELMGWKLTTVTGDTDWNIIREDVFLMNDVFPVLKPYHECVESLAQFAAILLKFPEVMERFISEEEFDGINDRIQWLQVRKDARCIRGEYSEVNRMLGAPTQTNILDEILHMNGVDV